MGGHEDTPIAIAWYCAHHVEVLLLPFHRLARQLRRQTTSLGEELFDPCLAEIVVLRSYFESSLHRALIQGVELDVLSRAGRREHSKIKECGNRIESRPWHGCYNGRVRLTCKVVVINALCRSGADFRQFVFLNSVS